MSGHSSSTSALGKFVRSFFVLLLIAQVAALGWLIYSDQARGRIQAGHQSQIQAMEHALDRVVAAMEQQSSVLDRTIGKIVPVRMPAGWSERLAELERDAADSSRWPKTDHAAQRYLDATSDLIAELPPWAETEYMGRLNVIRWSAMVYTTINPPGDAQADLHGRAELLAALSDSAPVDAPAELVEYVDKEQSRLVREADEEDWHLLHQRAASYVAEPNAAPSSSLQQDFALLIAYSDSEDATRRDQAEALMASLRKTMLRREAEQQADSLRSRMDSLMQLKKSDAALYATGIGVLFNEARAARVTLALSGLEDAALDQIDAHLLAELEELQSVQLDDHEVARATAVRAYQQYALRSIDLFTKRYEKRKEIANDALTRIREGRRDTEDYADLPSVCDAIKGITYEFDVNWYGGKNEKFELDGSKVTPESHVNEHRICRDAMIAHLLPIDLSLLELPVNELYQKAWEEGWKHLDGREDQTYVAQRTADVKKATLADFHGGRR